MDAAPARLRTERRTIYVRVDAGPEGDGRTPRAAYRQISDAFGQINEEGAHIAGQIVVDVGPGEYEGGIRAPASRAASQDHFIRIIGSKGADGVPTTIIRHSQGKEIGLVASDGTALELEDLKFVGGHRVAILLNRNVYAWFSNVHMDGEGVGHRGLSMSMHCRYYVRGGLIENYIYSGVDEYFLCSRNYSAAKSYEDQLRIRNCGIGLRAKEGCVGHLDYLQVEDCDTGIELIQHSVANCKAVMLKRNGVGLALVNSTCHNEGGIRWGVGADANHRDTYSAGASAELVAFGWSGESMARESSVGHRPLLVVANNFTERRVSSVKKNSGLVASLPKALSVAFSRTAGKHFTVKFFGEVKGAAPEHPVTIEAHVGSECLGEIALTRDGQALVEFDAVCVEDGRSFLVRASATVDGATKHTVNRTSILLESNPRERANVNVGARFTSRSQFVRNDLTELWA